MPNWCYNRLTIRGKPKQLHKLIKKVERTKSEETEYYSAGKFSFNNIIPMPDELFNGQGWYEWRINNWDTKWEAREDFDTFDQWESGEIFIEFATAWSPPTSIINALVKEFTQLSFEWSYDEESEAYWGKHTFSNGEEVSYDGGEFSTCAEYIEFNKDTHHYCKRCENFIEGFCDESDETEVEACPECLEMQEIENQKINNLDESLWEGEINATKENA